MLLAGLFLVFIWIWHDACDSVEQAMFLQARAAYEFIQVLHKGAVAQRERPLSILNLFFLDVIQPSEVSPELRRMVESMVAWQRQPEFQHLAERIREWDRQTRETLNRPGVRHFVEQMVDVANLEADEHYPEDDDDQVMIRLAEVRCTNGDLPTGTRS